MLTESSLREFYEHVYPVELVTKWLSYDLARDESATASARPRATNGAAMDHRGPAAAGAATTAEGYLARREFCFTLMGDIFTRFRSYSTAVEVRAELVRNFPEKIDVGAVYNVRPNMKQVANKIAALERELVFDIDMSDYDNVRSCCTGKVICSDCWAWMSCAAHVLRAVLTEDFGFKYLLPVFSGRRGVHLWVCDRRARALHNDERAAIVGYLTVVVPKTLRSSVVNDLASHRPIHPTIRGVLLRHIEPAFMRLFVNSEAENPNNMGASPKAAAIVHDAVLSALKAGRRDHLNKFVQGLDYTEGQTIDFATLVRALGTEHDPRDILHAAQLLLMYPRLDEHVSTMREHLLKLPFCVHPGTGSLCCPLTWDGIDGFDPLADAPKLDAILMERHIDDKWLAPLTQMLQEMQDDPAEPQW